MPARIPVSLLLLSLVFLVVGAFAVGFAFWAEPALGSAGLAALLVGGILTFAVGAGLLAGARWAGAFALVEGALDVILAVNALVALVMALFRGAWGDALTSALVAVAIGLFAWWIFRAVGGHWAFFRAKRA